MIRDGELKELLAFEGAGSPVLSLYLTVDPARRTKDECRLRVRQLTESNGAAPAAEDLARVEDFLRYEYDWQAKGLAIFSCTPKKFWRVVRLAIPILESATVTDKPYLRPLSEVLGSQEHIGVALVDREVARFFGIFLGEIEELGDTRRNMPRRHKQNEASPKLQRRADEGAQQNLRQAAKDGAEVFKEFNATQVVLGGQAEMTATFREQLPKAWQGRVIGEVAMDTEAAPAQVLAKANEVIGRAEAEREVRLVEALEGASRKKGPTGTTGLADTLTALMDGKVMTLITADGYRAEGFQCENCGYLSAMKIQPCPVCGHTMQRVEHAVDLAIRKALDNDARVEAMRSENAVRRMHAVGGIGAMLRY